MRELCVPHRYVRLWCVRVQAPSNAVFAIFVSAVAAIAALIDFLATGDGLSPPAGGLTGMALVYTISTFRARIPPPSLCSGSGVCGA